MRVARNNLFTQAFKSFHSNLEDVKRLESLLDIFEEVVSRKVFAIKSRPVFKYDCAPSSALIKDLSDFLQFFQLDRSFIEKLALDCDATVVVSKGDKLRVSIELRENLNEEVEARVLKTKKTLAGINLVYSKQNKRIGLSAAIEKTLEKENDTSAQPLGREALDA